MDRSYRVFTGSQPKQTFGLITDVQVVGTTEREILPGEALKPLSQHYLSIPGCMVGREGGSREKKRERDRVTEKQMEERREALKKPSPTISPLQTELKL